MGLHIERIGDVALVMPKGMMKGGKETDELEKNLRKLVYDDQQKILLDLGETTFLSSIAISVLVSVHISSVNRNLQFFVCNLDKRIKNIMVTLKLLQVLKVYNTREDALAAFLS